MAVTKQIMVVDALTAGMSGDMMVGALLDLGASAARVVEAMRTPKDHLKGCKSLEITISDTARRGFRAKKVTVKAEEEVVERTASELIEAATSSLNRLIISDQAKQFTLTCLNTLVAVESRVHGVSAEANHTHLHELASVDTLADIIGSAVALDDLNLFTGTKIYSTAVAVGGGLLNFSHGTVSSPAPATLEILRSKGFPMVGGPVEAELATPTGVSLLTNLAHESIRFYPPVKPIAVGYGAGTKDFPEVPNVLRIILGEPGDYGLLTDEVYVLETNLDDTTGEVIGHTVDRLLREGARDVSIIPMFTKKNRPGQIIKIIADNTSLERLSQVLIEETGTLGVRFYPCERRILARESVSVEVILNDTRELVTVKVAQNSRGEIIQIKPNYDEVKNLAGRTGMSLREIMYMVTNRAREILLARQGHEGC